MKKFILATVLCLAAVVNACWFGDLTDQYIYLARVNSTVRVTVLANEPVYISGFAVSLPYSIGMLQNLSAISAQGITQAKLQYSVYRASSTSDVQALLNGGIDFDSLTCRKVIPWQTVCTLGNGSTVLPMTSDQIISYFGSYRVRPNRTLVKRYDLIVIRVWMTDGFIESGNLSADLPPELFRRSAAHGSDDANLGTTGWHPNFAVCVVFNGNWGAR